MKELMPIFSTDLLLQIHRPISAKYRNWSSNNFHLLSLYIQHTHSFWKSFYFFILKNQHPYKLYILFLFILILFGIGLHINKGKECTKNYYVPIYKGEKETELKHDPINFEIEDDTPELFNSDDGLDNDQEFSSFVKKENNNEEDELEIPAFLRRQKN